MADASPAYPVFLDLRNRLAVVIGGGTAGERKVRGLLKHGADVAVLAANPTPTLIQAETDGLITIERRGFEPGDLAGAFIAICVEPAEDVRQAVFAEAEERGCLVSIPEAPDHSNFSAPSVVRRGGLQIAISTGGLAPAAAKQVRMRLQEEFGEEWAAYVTLLGEFRQLLAERLPGGDAADRRYLEAAVASDLLERIRDGHAPDAEQLFDEFVSSEALDAGDAGTGDAAAGDDAVAGAAAEDANAAHAASGDAAAAPPDEGAAD